MTPASLSVVVPALNEEANLEPTVQTLRRALSETIGDFEIIIVDDGSIDGTAIIADRLAAGHSDVRVLHNPRNMGPGYSYSRGVAIARKKAAVFIPGDNGWPYHSLLALFEKLGATDIVTSYAMNAGVRPLLRRVLSRLYTILLNKLFGHQLRYYNGLTIYPTAFLRSSPVTTYGFAFMAESLLRALSQGLSYVEVGLPIAERTSGRSKALTFRNFMSVIATIGRLFWELRIMGRWGRPTATTSRRADM